MLKISQQDVLAGYETDALYDFEIISITRTRSPSTLILGMDHRPYDGDYLWTFEGVSAVRTGSFFMQNVVGVVRVVTGAVANGAQWKSKIEKLSEGWPKEHAQKQFDAVMNERAIFIEIDAVFGIEVSCIFERFRYEQVTKAD